MNITIEGKTAVLKKGTSFEYVAENRWFSDADSYTLSITFPLKDCPENVAIFGHIERMDSFSRKKVMQASIVDGNVARHGVITVIEASESEVKTQFLEGRSVQNFDTTFDDIYINELDLGKYPASNLQETPLFTNINGGNEWTCLPWWNEESGVMNNEVFVDNSGNYYWSDDTKAVGKLSYQLYLIAYAKRICQAVGYTYDFEPWERSDERLLLVCNALPAAWDIPDFARALPHWSVAEFFDELEKLLVAEFDIDHRSMHISMRFTSQVQSIDSTVRLENIVDAFSAEVSYDDPLAQFKGAANVRYSDRGDERWKLDQCQWLVDIMKTGKFYKEFETLEESDTWVLENVFKGNIFSYFGKDEERSEAMGTMLHVKDCDRYYIFRIEPYEYYDGAHICSREEINRFGDLLKSGDDGDSIELQCLPAYINNTDYKHGYCVFLSPSSYNETTDLDDDGVRQPVAYSLFMKGEPDSVAEYYNTLFLAYWDGTNYNDKSSINGEKRPPCPCVDERFSLRNRYGNYIKDIKIETKEKLKVSWISDTIPDVRAIFMIRGRRYLCEKITATFTENGMSQLLKGVFWQIPR